MKLIKIKPMFTGVVTTMWTEAQDVIENNLLDTTKQQGSIKMYQKVLAVGPSVSGIKEGDLVCINPMRYAVRQHKEGSLKDGVITDNPVLTYNFRILEIDGQDCLYLQNNDIEFVIEEFEEVQEDITLIS